MCKWALWIRHLVLTSLIFLTYNCREDIDSNWIFSFFLNVGPTNVWHLFGHLVWSIFQSVIALYFEDQCTPDMYLLQITFNYMVQFLIYTTTDPYHLHFSPTTHNRYRLQLWFGRGGDWTRGCRVAIFRSTNWAIRSCSFNWKC